MSTDARSNTKTWLLLHLDNSNLTKDDGTTQVSFIVCFGFPSYPLVRVFNDKAVDLVFSVGKPRVEALLDESQAAYAYREHIPIETYCVSKQGITDEKLNWKAEHELRRITELYHLDSQRSLSDGEDNTKRFGGTKICSTRYIMGYERPAE